MRLMSSLYWVLKEEGLHIRPLLTPSPHPRPRPLCQFADAAAWSSTYSLGGAGSKEPWLVCVCVVWWWFAALLDSAGLLTKGPEV